jgi:predicted enzyme related to lactoylglutathione lyase
MNESVYAIVFDCGDAAKLAQFWSATLNRPIDGDASADFASIGLNDPASKGPGLMFNKVPEAKSRKNRVHLDLTSPDLDATVQRLMELGASKGDEYREDGSRWVTLADPEGNEFDVLAG